jgi:hypothetical protein
MISGRPRIPFPLVVAESSPRLSTQYSSTLSSNNQSYGPYRSHIHVHIKSFLMVAFSAYHGLCNFSFPG